MKTISDHILDILQNSTRASASTVELEIKADEVSGLLTVMIRDNGSGMEPAILKSVTDPFTTTRRTRKVGLGLPLLRQHAEMTGGSVEVESERGVGTTIRAAFLLNSIDRQPLGDLAEIVTLFITGNCGVNLQFSYSNTVSLFEISRSDIVESLEDEELSKPVYFRLIKELISENLLELGADTI
jgi:hypothetical protein